MVLGLLGLATWALSHSYAGIYHDAGLYTLQALAHLGHEALSTDVFLKFGSQDRFTVFTSIYAVAGRLFGLEPAAAILTLLSQLAMLTGAWFLARAVMSSSLAVLGIAVFLAIPGDYGTDRIFTCIEPFLTPRMAAEALVMASLAAALGARTLLAVILVIAAALLHPIMAMVGVTSLSCLYGRRPKPITAIALVTFVIATLMLAAFAMPAGQWGRFDPEWLTLIRNRSPYLFLGHWQLEDWSRAAVMLATLTAGIYGAPNSRTRALCVVTFMTVLSGWVLTLIACDMLHLVLFTQLQPWRCQWLGTVTAALLLPEIIRALWSRNTAGQTSCLLLIAAWIFASDVEALAAAVATLSVLAILPRIKSSEARWIFWGAAAMLAIAVVWRVASDLEFTDAHYLEPDIPFWVRHAMSFTHDGSAPVAIIAMTWWLARSPRRRPALITLAVLAAAGCAALLPQTWRSWTARQYTVQQVARFANFREHIAQGAEVFWPESPVGVWMLLGRPSYLSMIQTSGMVFSRRSALELDRRAAALSSAVNPDAFMNWSGGAGMTLSQQQLKRACSTGEFDFLVSTDLGTTPVATIRSTTGPASKEIRLYRCRSYPVGTGSG